MSSPVALSNAEIADKLGSLAQVLSTQKENPFKIKAYRRAAKTIRTLSESISELVRTGADLTEYAGIGKAIGGAIREIAQTGTLKQLETLRSQLAPEVAAISEYPRLDPGRVLRVYKKLKIASIDELREKLASGEIAEKLGARMDQHVRQALTERQEILIHEADKVAAAVRDFLLANGATRAEIAGDLRRRVEVIGEISFLIETGDFAGVVSKLKQYGGRSQLLNAGEDSALFKLPSECVLRVEAADKSKWGLALIAATGSDEHVRKLQASGANLVALAKWKTSYRTETSVYRAAGLSCIEPELREGRDEIDLAASDALPRLVYVSDIRGELHAHSTSSDGAHTIEQMAAAAQARGYEYTGITDHSQSLKIAGGLSISDLRAQIRYIDKWNEKSAGFRVLKSAEVDILEDGSLDYPDELLKQLDYTVCSIHSRFILGKAQQTARILRAMDYRYFTILGHATGRLLLKRPGYEIDIERVIEHARKNGCFFEINSSPDRLDLSASNARLASEAGVKIAINTDAHSTREFGYIQGGVDQARRAGLEKKSVLNTYKLPELLRLLKR
ncbi:MAG: PHP domain-containing protein [Acidobacteriota bacterium]|nr:PHP domain-containing protein [Acidobacteriota bacterium]